MSGPPRIVHIAPFGAETKRITEPAFEWRADHVVLVDYLFPPGPYEHIHDEVLTTLDDAGIDYSTPEYDIQGDLFGAVAAISSEIESHADDLVYVNLASGSKVTAIAGMIAAMTSEEATPYYVEADDAGSVAPTPATNVGSIEEIPRYPMDRPEYQHIAIMKFISESVHSHELGDSESYQDKTSLYEFGDAAGLRFMSGAEDATSEAKFGRLDGHIIKPLQKREYIEVEQVGQHRRVMLTELGRNTLRSFEHILSDETRDAIRDSTHTER